MYKLTIQIRNEMNTFAIGYNSREEALNRIEEALEQGFFRASDFYCTLGPGCVIRLENQDAIRTTFTPKTPAFHIIVSMFDKQLTLDFESEEVAEYTLRQFLKTGAIQQSFKGGEDCVWVWVEPGTSYLKLSAADYHVLQKASEPDAKKVTFD